MSQLTAAGITDLSSSAQQCLKWNHALLPMVEAGLGCTVALTIGQVLMGERSIFDPNLVDFTRWAENGIDASDFVHHQGFNFHAWYTLPSMEILDLTLWSTLALALSKPEKAGEVVGGWPDVIAPHPTYIPMVVGNSYPEHVHKISSVPLLSNDVSQGALSEIFVMFTRK